MPRKTGSKNKEHKEYICPKCNKNFGCQKYMYNLHINKKFPCKNKIINDDENKNDNAENNINNKDNNSDNYQNFNNDKIKIYKDNIIDNLKQSDNNINLIAKIDFILNQIKN